MEHTKRIMCVFGTRPEAIKMAPVIHALQRESWACPITTVTAQHRQILDQVLDLFRIRPDHDLDILEPGQTLTRVTTRVLEGLTEVFRMDQPDLVVVQGDTTTTFAAALAAFYAHVPVAHLEAGLRTGDLLSPFPEELNRQATSRLATLHLAPTPSARDNLIRESIDPATIRITGNTVIDALRWAVGQRAPFTEPVLDLLEMSGRPLLLVTAHRRESWGIGMASIARALAELARREPDLEIVFPIHPNPVVRDAVLPAVKGMDNVHVIEPLSYGEFARLMDRATIVMTDSGGVQEEAPSLGKPVLVMREVTERPEAVVAGTARLVGTDQRAIVETVQLLLHDPVAFDTMATAVNPYGDGLAGARSVLSFAQFFGMPVNVPEFDPGEQSAPAPRGMAGLAVSGEQRGLRV